MEHVNKSLSNISPFALRHVEKFIVEWSLFPKSAKLVLLISGGKDSMALLHLMQGLQSRMGLQLRVVHFHHGLSPENDQMKDLVEQVCQSSALRLEVFKLHLSAGANLEKRSRDARKHCLKKSILPDEYILTGHHLNDSWEWALMQSFRQKEWRSGLGIPVVNHKVRRPFLCLTRNQIDRYVRSNRIRFVEDFSNDQTRFERNYVRKEIIPAIERRFPKALSHYVQRSLALASQAGVLRGQARGRRWRRFTIWQQHSVAAIGLDRSQTMAPAKINSGAISEALAVIHQVRRFLILQDKQSRSSLGDQLFRIADMARHNRFGPLFFSSSVKLVQRAGFWMMFKSSLEFSPRPEQTVFTLSRQALRAFLRGQLKKASFWHHFPAPFVVSGLNEQEEKRLLKMRVIRKTCSCSVKSCLDAAPLEIRGAQGPYFSDVPTLLVFLRGAAGAKWCLGKGKWGDGIIKLSFITQGPERG